MSRIGSSLRLLVGAVGVSLLVGVGVSAYAAPTITFAPVAGSPVAVGDTPFGVAVNPLTNQIYVANTSSNTVTQIDGSSNIATYSYTVPAGSLPRAVAVNPDKKKLYVVNSKTNIVSVFDTGTKTLLTTINLPAGSFSTGIAVNPVTNRVYVANTMDNSVTVINGTLDIEITKIPLGAGFYPYNVAVNQIQNKVYVTNNGTGTVSVIDMLTNTVIGTPIMVGSQPRGVAVDLDRSLVYVANANSGTISVIDASGAVVGMPIPVGGVGPSGIAVNPITNRIYVSNPVTNNLSVIDGATSSPIMGSPFSTGTNPFSLAFNSKTNRLYVANIDTDNVSVFEENVGPEFTVVTSPPKGQVNALYIGFQVTASGFPAPAFSASSALMDAGLSINSGTGVISGTPKVAGTVSFTVTAMNGLGSVTQNLSIVVDPADAPPAFTSGVSLPPGQVGVSYPKFQVTASGFPAPKFSASSALMDAGLSIDPATGEILGKPKRSGTVSFTVTAMNGLGSVTQNLSIVIDPAPAGVSPAGTGSSAGIGSGRLPNTGFDGNGMGGVAMMMLAGGAALLLKSRKKTEKS